MWNERIVRCGDCVFGEWGEMRGLCESWTGCGMRDNKGDGELNGMWDETGLESSCGEERLGDLCKV